MPRHQPLPPCGAISLRRLADSQKAAQLPLSHIFAVFVPYWRTCFQESFEKVVAERLLHVVDPENWTQVKPTLGTLPCQVRKGFKLASISHTILSSKPR